MFSGIDITQEALFCGGLFSLTLCKWAWLYALGRRGLRPGDLECVGTVQSLCVSPVKSLRGFDTQTAHCGYVMEKNGVPDRHWFVAGSEGTFLMDLKYEPSLALVEQHITDGHVEFRAPNMRAFRLPATPPESQQQQRTFRFHHYEVKGLDCGDAVAEWFTRFLQKDARLYHFASKPRLDQSLNDLSGAAIKEKNLDLLGDGITKPRDVFLVASESSLKQLNTSLVDPVRMRNFRPNIVVSCIKAYDEDDWAELFIGSAGFQTSKLCGRCIRTTVNTDTGVMHTEMQPLKTLRAKRMLPEEASPVFGNYFISTSTGTVSVGDNVYAMRKSQQKNFMF